LVVRLDAPIGDGINAGGILCQHLASQVAMQHGGGKVRLKRRDLPISLFSIVGCDANNAHWTFGEGLDLLNGPARLDDTVFPVVVYPSQIIVGPAGTSLAAPNDTPETAASDAALLINSRRSVFIRHLLEKLESSDWRTWQCG